MQKFPELFQYFLDICGTTQGELARYCGFSPTHLSDIKNGNRRPTVDFINKLCLALELTEKEKRELHEAAARDRGFEV